MRLALVQVIFGFLVFIICVPLLHLPKTLVDYVFGSFALSGLVLWFYSWHHMGKKWGLGEEPKGFIKSGPFHFFKHPIYFGSSAFLFFLQLYTRSLSAAPFFLFFLVFTLIRARLEEFLLKQEFEGEWEAYSLPIKF